MNNFGKLFLVCLLVTLIGRLDAATLWTISSATPANWNSDVWAITSGGAPQAGLRPLAGDVLNIRRSLTLDITTPLISTITISSSRTLTITSSGTLSFSNLTLSGTLTVDVGGNLSGGNITFSGGTLNTNGNNVAFGNVTITSGNFSNNDLGGIISITGNLVNHGNFNASNSTFSFIGSSTQSIGGTMDVLDINVASGAILTLANSNDAIINLLGNLTLNGTATFDADGSDGTGIFTVTSSDLQNGGKIGPLPTPANFTGDVSVIRYINGVTSGDYRYISVPITNANAGILRNYIGVTGNFSDRNTSAEYPNIVNGGNTTASIYSFNPATQTYVALSGGGGTTTSTALSNLSGYAAYNFSDADVWIEYRGTIGKGNVNIPISSVNEGFSLVPNPYPSPLNWDAVYQSNPTVVTGAIFWRTANFTYSSYAGSLTGPPQDAGIGQIATGQAFWVESSGGGSTLTISESHKSTGDNFGTFIRQETPINYFRIMLASATQKDYAVIRFHDNTTDGKDNYYDAVKRRNGNYISATGRYTYLNLSSYTTTAAKDYSINSVDELNECSKLFGLKIVDVKPGDHKFQFTSLEKLELGYKVILVDNFLNKEKVINNNDEYLFAVTNDAASFGDARFKLRIEKSAERLITVQGQTLMSNISAGNQWYKDGVLIPGATAATFEVRASGNYTVKSTVDGCEGAAESITMAITAVPEISKEVNFVYPNPTSGKITIKLSQEKDAALTGIFVYDVKGSVVTGSDKDLSLLKPGEKSIDISNSKNGVYILNLVSKKEIKSIRLIKK